MSTNLIDEFLHALPAGEWANARPLEDNIGIMARRAVRATATWARKGIPVFLKCTPVSREGVSSFTGLLTDPNRLEGIRLRLTRAQLTSGPLVKLHYVDWIGEDEKWLLIAMDPVQPLSEALTASVPNTTLAISVLRTLAVARCDGWFHFDICPSNTGVDVSGRVVFIDPESYFELRPRSNVSIGLAKWMRLSPLLRRALRNQPDETTVPRELAEAKHNSEVLLLAAECCLGHFNRQEFNEQCIRDWCRDPACDPRLQEFWLPHLLEACAGDALDLAALSDTLERVSCAPPQDKPDPVLTLPSEPQSVENHPPAVIHSTLLAPPPARSQPVEGPTSNTRTSPAEVAILATADKLVFDIKNLTDWSDFEPIRRAMRERRLNSSQLAMYRTRLQKCAEAEPKRREWWVELLMLTLVYLIDPVDAARVAAAALTHFPNDEEFIRDRQMAERWRHG